MRAVQGRRGPCLPCSVAMFLGNGEVLRGTAFAHVWGFGGHPVKCLGTSDPLAPSLTRWGEVTFLWRLGLRKVRDFLPPLPMRGEGARRAGEGLAG